MAQLYVLFEHAAGYTIFKSSGYEESDFLSQVYNSVLNVNDFKEIISCVVFQPFKTGRDALENMNSVSEGILHTQLQEFLENNVPKTKKKKHPVVLGVSEAKLASAISERLEITCTASNVVGELTRGIRFHFHDLVDGFSDLEGANKAQLGLGHHYSRARVKFNVNRIDNMIIQSISLLDQLDKDINTFTMRVREWYSHHFPELIKVVPENILYILCIKVIKDRKDMPKDVEEQLEEILKDPIKVAKIIELARSSMGMDIAGIDLENVYVFAERIMSLMQRRKDLQVYLRSKMESVAPNLAALIGDVVGARLIAHAGSLINLAKYPASTVQILGAEKALFRALKTKGNTPKYGLIFHSKFIGKAAKSNKGRISRYLANKCSVASRIDCFRDVPTNKFGIKLRAQVEERLKFYETGDLPQKNVDAMTEAMQEADVAEVEILKQLKKAKKKAKKAKLGDESMSGMDSSIAEDSAAATEGEEDTSLVKKSKKKKKKRDLEEQEMDNGHEESLNDTTEEPPKKKKKSLGGCDTSIEMNNSINGDSSLSASKKKKKKSFSEKVAE